MTPEQARAELARRELARRGVSMDSDNEPLGQRLLKGLKSPWSVGLKLPEQLSREGLGKLSSMVPNPEPKGNLLMDIARGTPRIAAETLEKTAPPFVSRGAIVTAGVAPALKAVRPLASMARQGLFRQAEDMAMGSKGEGALGSSYQDWRTIFAKGKKAAGPLYDAAKKEIPSGANIFKGMYKPDEIVDAAQTYMSKGGKLEPAEALMARKAVDALMGSKRYVKDELMALRSTVDEMAKASKNIESADPIYRRGMKAEALRKFLPQNLRGGTSPFKMAIGTALTEMGPLGKVLSLALSPAALGTGATGLGIATRQIVTPLMNNPKLAAAVYAALKTEMEVKGDTP